ncbi:MAG: hypothetical protein AB7Q81_00215 [Gammaproteobacteria bacterium]
MRFDAPLLLVGSIPGADAEQAMRAGAALGGLLGALPDGETGRRKAWINFLAAGAYHDCAALEVVNRPLPHDIAAADEWRAPADDWIPRGYADHWQFRVVTGQVPQFGVLGYAAQALASWQVFERLRGEGVITPGVRFQVALPLAESAVRPFMTGVADYAPVHAAYVAALRNEIDSLCSVIPHDRLAVQWDIAFETVAIDRDDNLPGVLPWIPPGGSPRDRYLAALRELAAHVPDTVPMGLHLCYGDLGHRHIVEPRDLGVCVEMTNLAVTALDRAVDYCHMPVPRERCDDAYFAPLTHLAAPATCVYLGLVHHTDGLPGTRARIAVAQRHLARFGIATECGFGRRTPATVPELLAIHREAAALLAND